MTYDDGDGILQFSLTVEGCANSDTDGDNDAANGVELRYYSTAKMKIFTVEKISFTPGTIHTNIKPQWKK